MSNYWWQNGNEGKVYIGSSGKTVHKKEKGGFVFRDMEWFNKVMLGKKGWCLIHNTIIFGV